MKKDLFGNPTGLCYKSPLGYPGGKYFAAKYIAKYIPNVDVMLAPFVGSGKLELQLTKRATRVLGYDAFEPLTNCWYYIKNDYRNLYNDAYNFIEEHIDDLDVFRNLQKSFTDMGSDRERATAYLILNRICFLGSVFRGTVRPIYLHETGIKANSGPILMRKPKLHFELYPEMFFNPLFEVDCLDFRESLEKHSDLITYLDPPYPVVHGFYGDSPEYHETFPHEDLAKILYDRKQFWVLSYNDSEIIQDLYPLKDFRYEYPNFRHVIRKQKRINEVLIMPKGINGVF